MVSTPVICVVDFAVPFRSEICVCAIGVEKSVPLRPDLARDSPCCVIVVCGLPLSGGLANEIGKVIRVAF